MKELIKDKFKGRVQVETIRYFKNNWGIIICSVTDVDKKYEKPKVNNHNYITLKGVMPEPQIGEEYNVNGKLIEDPKWGDQYELKTISSVITIGDNDKIGQKQYLLNIYPPSLVEEMYKSLDDPFYCLGHSAYDKLVQVKGIGAKKAMWMVKKFQEKYSLAKVLIELEQYELTTNMVNRLVNHYGSAELAIEKVKDNPYSLVEIGGIGWSRADDIALKGGIDKYGVKRVQAFILHFLEQMANDGFNYISSDILMDGIVENIGEEVTDFTVAQSIHDLGDKLWYSEDHEQIGLMYYYKLEKNIATELIRIRDAKSKFNIDGWEDIIKDTEIKQGWEYTEQQKYGVEMVLKNNVVCITGKAGVGKSSIADGMLKVLPNYSHCLCALSGKAGARIAEITGEEGFTIHRLLGYPDMSADAKNRFKYHNENPLPYEIIIVDEISMINGRLFYYLLRAVKNGSKLILLGDIAQLESIGECKVAADIIESCEIPTVILDKIHRQAAKSAIVTESLKIRDGEQIIDKDWVGVETRGELKDFTINCFSDKSNTYYKTLEYFQKNIQNKDIFDVQILCPVKARGDASTYNINLAIQELYNPLEKQKQLSVFNNGKSYFLREGDKVINRKNNYKTLNDKGVCTPIFNGMMGILREIDLDNGTYIIDFQNIGTIIVDDEQIKTIELGYAITVHSSQGSQFEIAIIAIDYAAYSLLSRELLYTAITRAQKKCILVAQNSALRFATSQEKISEKTSHLVNTLDEIAHPKLVF